MSSSALFVILLFFRLIPAIIYLLMYHLRKPFMKFDSSYILENRAEGKKIQQSLSNIVQKIKEI